MFNTPVGHVYICGLSEEITLFIPGGDIHAFFLVDAFGNPFGVVGHTDLVQYILRYAIPNIGIIANIAEIFDAYFGREITRHG